MKDITVGKIVKKEDEYSTYFAYVIQIYGQEFSFNVSDIPETRHEWLCSVLNRHFYDVVELVKSNTKKQIFNNIHESLGLDTSHSDRYK